VAKTESCTSVNCFATRHYYSHASKEKEEINPVYYYDTIIVHNHYMSFPSNLFHNVMVVERRDNYNIPLITSVLISILLQLQKTTNSSFFSHTIRLVTCSLCMFFHGSLSVCIGRRKANTQIMVTVQQPLTAGPALEKINASALLKRSCFPRGVVAWNEKNRDQHIAERASQRNNL